MLILKGIPCLGEQKGTIQQSPPDGERGPLQSAIATKQGDPGSSSQVKDETILIFGFIWEKKNHSSLQISQNKLQNWDGGGGLYLIFFF